MTYPFVSSFVQGTTARGPRKAVVWHMAEGGGTVGWLSGGNDPNGVSVHYVIEYTGRVVQMLSLSQMHTSIKPTAIRSTDDKPFDWRGTPIVYGATAARAVMGDWANTAKTLGPNHASIAVEFEGFASRGPNDKQKDAAALLWAYLADQYPGIRSLAHRDFQSYKACPGKFIPWEELGGHGPIIAKDNDMPSFTILKDKPIGSLTLRADADIKYLRIRDGALIATDPTRFGYKDPAIPVRLLDPIIRDKPRTDDWMLGYVVGDEAAFILARNVIFSPRPTFGQGRAAALTDAIAAIEGLRS